ncbi:MAG: CPBP family intramembrane metalloprotease [Prevotellaceae bacterium]|jgi:membrane protease YdiL (CAAX protease family)|nr:CPBP family intramembrane metalloprotease [Prevotellaceae bacterium]
MEVYDIINTERKPLLKGWIRALLIIIPFFIFTGVFEVIGYFVLGLQDAKSKTFTETTISQIISTAGTFLLIYIFTRFIDRKDFKSVGFQLKGYTKDIFSGIVLGAVIMTVGFLILLALNEIKVTDVVFNIYNLFISIVLFVFVAFNEEVFLRGYVLNNFLQSMNKYLALILSSLIFSLLHIFNPNFDLMSFAGIFLAGILLGISYIYTKNLWFPIALHFSWNFFQGTVFGFEVSGLSMYSIINQDTVENNLLNGGEFGFEGSILSHIFIVIATLLIWQFAKKLEN